MPQLIIDPLRRTGTRRGGWWSGWVGSRELHVVPVDDCWDHVQDFCECNPLYTTLGGKTFIMQHNSYDWREMGKP